MKITLLRTTSCGCVPVGAGSWGGEECKQRPDHSRPAVLWERRWTNHRRFPWRLTTDQIISDTHTHTVLFVVYWLTSSHFILPHDAVHKRARSLSVSHVTFVHSVKMNKDIFNIFSPSGSHTILVFPYQTLWQYSDGNPPNRGIKCRWGTQKSGFPTSIWLHRVLSMLRLARCYQHVAAEPWQ